MSAGYSNIYLNQGETFTTDLTLTDDNGSPYNLVDFNIKSHAKKSYYTSNVAIVFTTSIVDSNNGTIQLSLNSSVSANVSPGNYVYDVLLINTVSGIVSRVLEGQLIVSPAVTFA